MSNHTPGEWKVESKFNGHGGFAIMVGDIKIATIYCAEPVCAGYGKGKDDLSHSLKGQPTANANAKLIAASPTMYEYINKKAKEGCVIAQKIIDDINA